MSPIVREPVLKLSALGFGDRQILRLVGDAVPEVLDVEDTLGRGHLVEGGFHRQSIAEVAEGSRAVSEGATERVACAVVADMSPYGGPTRLSRRRCSRR